MAWTYSGDPSSSKKDEVRFLIGDTNTKDQLLLDAEINYLLGQHSQNSVMASARACEVLMAKFSRMADEQVGQVKINFSQKAKGYATLRDDLRRRIAMEQAMPYAGGISVADKEANRQDQDRSKPAFAKDMMDNNQTSPWITVPEPYGQGREAE